MRIDVVVVVAFAKIGFCHRCSIARCCCSVCTYVGWTDALIFSLLLLLCVAYQVSTTAGDHVEMIQILLFTDVGFEFQR